MGVQIAGSCVTSQLAASHALQSPSPREGPIPSSRTALTGVAIGEQGADGQQDLGDGERGAPLVFEDVQADAAVAVDVTVVDARPERDLEGLGGWAGGVLSTRRCTAHCERHAKSACRCEADQPLQTDLWRLERVVAREVDV